MKRRGADDNPTVGIVLCAGKDSSVVKYSVLYENEQLFATKCRLFCLRKKNYPLELERDQQWLAERQPWSQLDSIPDPQ
ncbi:hypothetical protein [uncultured Deefgea sp.]|uniref:hypothetical protein n=1 Tax=uncultured Deefgea sp. TaxID=1304914 RepID=UPI0026179A17|nr:hypothetical protein [uncultured Deefgea sp.]